MKISYTRDLEHNYMRIDPEGDASLRYALKMLQAQRVSGTLPFEQRFTDGKEELYVRIDTLQSLENRKLVRGLSAAELRKLLQALSFTAEQLNDYLLDVDTLLLTAEGIFYDRAEDTWRFVCYPYADEGKSLQTFAEALSSFADENDPEAVVFAQTLKEQLLLPGARIRDLFAGLEDVCKESLPQRSLYEEIAAGSSAEPYSLWDEPVRADKTRKEKGKKPAKKERKQGLNPRVTGLLFTLVLVAAFYLRREYAGTVLSKNLLLGVILCCAVCAALSFAAHFCHTGIFPVKRKSRSHGRKERRQRDLPEEIPEVARCGGVSVAQMFEEHPEETFTTCLSPGCHARSAKLYSRDSAYNCHISLDVLPLTIGQSAEADVSIAETSVSRTHAHISRDENGQIRIKDLNSTNGTFRNGIRLRPNEETALIIGDELRFGNMTFEYV